jgi:hypothetical protein
MSSSRTTPVAPNSLEELLVKHHRSPSSNPVGSDDDGDGKLDDTDKFESALLQYSRAIMKGVTDFDPDNSENLEKAISVTKQTVISLYHGRHLKSDIKSDNKGHKQMQELLKVTAKNDDLAKKLEYEAARVVILKADLLKEKESSSYWRDAYCEEEEKSQALLKEKEGKAKGDGSKKRKRIVSMWESAEKAKFDDDDK